ncbi:MAG: phasin family protein [Gammaproteobacteria bacterium]
MMNRIEKFADTLKSESRQFADRAIASLRTAGLETANLISKAKTPVNVFADTSLKLNNLSHKSIEKLLKQQVAILRDIIDGGVRRLEMASRAQSVRTLVDRQVSTLPKTRDHAMQNARKTVSIVRSTGEAFGDLFKDVVVDISSARKAGKPAAKKKATGRKPAAKKASAKKKTAGRKPAAKKASAKKTAAKKTTTRKAPAKQAESKAPEAAQAA